MRMRKILVMIIIALSVPFANSQVLWKITSPSGDKVSHVLGTHHFAPVSFLDSLAGLDEALKSCDKLYGEIIMADLMKPDYLLKMQQMMMAPADSTLDKVLSHEDFNKLKAVWKEYGNPQLPEQVLPMMKPAAISTQLAAFMAMKVLPPMNLMQGLDQTMQERAQALGKQVGALETADYQSNILMGAPISLQAEDLMETVNDVNGTADKVKRLTDAYLTQDYGALTRMFEESDAEDPTATEKLIYIRNNNWMKLIGEEMKTTPLMVVVGAGHLVGDRGILQSLRNLGYKVEPVK